MIAAGPPDVSVAAAACPKCGLVRREDAPGCARCGLVFALWTAESAAALAQLDGEGERLWAAVQESWADDALHDAFIKHCSATGVLPAAGRCYRLRLDATPGDGVALRMRDRILTMATVTFAPRASSPAALPVTRARWFWVVIVVAMVAGILGGLVFPRWIR